MNWIQNTSINVCDCVTVTWPLFPQGDKNWYRAVMLETSESEASIIYADYGNAERVPYSSIMPIPSHLLQLPFQITRCALTGKATRALTL